MDTKKIWETKQEIKELLKKHPELIPLQKKIDERMKGAGNQHNRLVIIKEMMMDSAKEMGEQLESLLKK